MLQQMWLHVLQMQTQWQQQSCCIVTSVYTSGNSCCSCSQAHRYPGGTTCATDAQQRVKDWAEREVADQLPH